MLGPYLPWMQFSNCFRLPVTVPDYKPGDVGGPMCISNGYRWNVPVVTYGFDQSFLDFFGTNGVAAVEGAIQILNDLPPSSSVVLTNYPNESQMINYDAQAQSLYDLQSVSLSLLLEQLGLASPTRSAYVVQSYTNSGTADQFSYDVTMLNYDPQAFNATAYVNRILYGYIIWSGYEFGVNATEAVTYPEPGSEPQFSAVADNRLEIGGFYTGLTEDDVGGLCYLLSTNNINYETLLSGVSGVGANSNLINGAWRPGVDKITFTPQPSGSLPWQFLPLTDQYEDTYITDGSVEQQQVQRVINQPDFLFCAGDAGVVYAALLPFARTGTSNWINNAALNGNPSGGGPGVIQPQVKIMFDKLGPTVFTYGPNLAETNYDESIFWGTYDQSTNAPIVYALPSTGTNQLLLQLWFDEGDAGGSYPFPLDPSVELSATGQFGASFLLQTSTNLTDWLSIATNQINGSIFTLIEDPLVTGRFYRLMPQ